jgi:acyl transferase domain-containing protein
MSNYNGVEIALIGMACQLPGADNVNEFWDNLRSGKESISFFTDQELLAAGIPEDVLHSPDFVKANACIGNKEYFDSAFFDYTPAEAKMMDPQFRLFHENCWKALEDAGYDVRTTTEKIGLFAGGAIDTNWENYCALENTDGLVDDFTASRLRNIGYLCSRISYSFDLRGPAVFLYTACSTSLVAVQKACMSLLLRECTMALAGGIRINNYTVSGYSYKEGMINSIDGHCRAFDEKASGFVAGEGVGVVLLKRLKDAIEDGDNIQAVIKGSAINNDGHQKISYTALSIQGQYAAILKAMNMARIEPESISYVEAHGTSTRLGDAIEVEALNLAFGKSEKRYCALGSVKSNIGHLDTAAGIAALIKTVLALKHRQIPPSLHFESPNPEISFNDSPFYVNTRLKQWETPPPPARPPPPPAPPPRMRTLSWKKHQE